VYHYTGVCKDEGLSVRKADSNPDDLADEMDVGASGQGDGASGEGAGGTQGEKRATYPLVATSRPGKMFEGTIKVVDSRAQACFIEFDDGECGWFQLWRAGEIVVVQ
jgi:hypothetical protein